MNIKNDLMILNVFLLIFMQKQKGKNFYWKRRGDSITWKCPFLIPMNSKKKEILKKEIIV